MSRKAWTLAGALFILVARKPDAALSPQFFGEDSKVFFLDAYERPWSSFGPYNGYYHLILRLIALLLSPIPPRWAPAAYAWAAIAVTMGVCAWLLSERTALSWPARCVAAIAVVAAPVNNEVFTSVVNSQWILALALPWLSISEPPRGNGQRAFDLAAAAGAGLTGPFSIFFAPLFALRLLVRRDRFSLLLLGVVCAAAVVQAVHLPSARPAPKGDVAALDFIACWGGPARAIFASWWRFKPIRLFAFAIAGLALWGFFAVQAARRRSFPLFVFAAGSVLCWAAALWGYRENPLYIMGVGRYLYAPVVLTITAMATFLPAPAACVALLVTAASALHVVTHARMDPDLDWENGSKCIGVADPCVVDVLPDWKLTVRPRR